MILQFPANMRIGVELEYCTLTPIRASLESSLLALGWSLGTDSSLRPKNDLAYMHELRHRIPVNKVDYTDLWHVLSLLKLHRAFTTRNCGMHVHFSHPQWAEELAKRLRLRLEKIPCFKEREEYCSWQEPVTEHWAGIHKLSDTHWEVRRFNGTLKFRGIIHNLELIHKEALLVAEESQASTNV